MELYLPVNTRSYVKEEDTADKHLPTMFDRMPKNNSLQKQI